MFEAEVHGRRRRRRRMNLSTVIKKTCFKYFIISLFDVAVLLKGIAQAADSLLQHFAQAKDPFEKVSGRGFVFLVRCCYDLRFYD